MRIPYGVANFADLRRDDYFYADKTPFLPVLEQADTGYRHLLFLRPRRFGKSLLLSMMEHYYDLGWAPRFDELFRGLWVHDHPTPERGQYLVATLDFSSVATDGGEDLLRRSFVHSVKNSLRPFLMRHRSRFPDVGSLYERLDGFDDASALLGAVLGVVAGLGQKLYLLIDEYDNFANRMLAEGAQSVYESIVRRTGFVRTFYATLKLGTQSGGIGRMFITGVSPILLDDLSSGFNIARHVSLHPGLATATGFTRAELSRGVDEFIAARPGLAGKPGFTDRATLLDVMERFYNGYRFHPDASERVFNSDMVLYFLGELTALGRYPDNMLDVNIRTDYRRLVKLGMLAGASGAERRAILETILTDGYLETTLVQQFGDENAPPRVKLISLLYFLGMLTFSAEPPRTDTHRLEIPNRVVRELQWEQLMTTLAVEAGIAVDTHDLEASLRRMAMEGDIEPFLGLFHSRVIKGLGLKDMRQLSEKSVKLMLMTYLSQSPVYHPLSEKELAQGYCDLFLAVSRQVPAARFAWLLELKYLPTGAGPERIEEAFAQAASQVARYASDTAVVSLLTGGKELKKGVLVFVGARKVLFREWPAMAPNEAPRAPTKKAPRAPTKKAPRAAKKAAPATPTKKAPRSAEKRTPRRRSQG